MLSYPITEVEQLVEGDIVKIAFRPGIRHYTWEIVCPYAKVESVRPQLASINVKGFTYRHLGEEYSGQPRLLETHYPVSLVDYEIKLFMFTREESERLEEEGHRLFV